VKDLILIAVIAFALYVFYPDSNEELVGGYGESHNELIMYSLTTCGYCKKKAKELRQENIAFTEYFIDKDNSRMNELNEKLRKAGFKARGYGTPLFDVKGYMLPNNPSLDKIKKYLELNINSEA